MNHEDIRRRVVESAQQLEREAILSATAGNLSARAAPDVIAITPSGMPYPDISPRDVVLSEATGHTVDGERRPSSELPLHLAVYQARPEICGVVHTHSPYATTLAVMRRPIPALHYAIAEFGVSEIPLVPYATFGSTTLADEVARVAGSGAGGALLANHGAIAFGSSVEQAATRAVLLEFLATLHYRALVGGGPVVLPDDEVVRVIDLYASYGQTPARARTPAH